MEFASESKQTVILDPARQMARRTIASEIRQDPLTGRTARICHFMALKWEKPDFDLLVAGTEGWCPFCPQRVFNVTPCFVEELIPEGRLTDGDMVLFPNIAPYDSLSACATMGSDHFVPMTAFGPQRIARGFKLAQRFFRRVAQSGHPESVYHIINWNYMPPAGSSLIHPHLQVFATASAPNLMRAELEAARAYARANGTCFWDDLVATETASGQRLLGTIGRSTWLGAFAPMGVAGDVVAVVQGVSGTLELTDADFDDLALGLSRVMAGYDRMGIYSFNMNFFTGPAGDDSTRFHLVFSPRTFFNQKLGATDIGALRNLFNETLCMAFPEEITGMLREGIWP